MGTFLPSEVFALFPPNQQPGPVAAPMPPQPQSGAMHAHFATPAAHAASVAANLSKLHAPNGRSDDINKTVPAGTYVVPADAASKLGQGSSKAGAEFLRQLVAQAKARYQGPQQAQAPQGQPPQGQAPQPLRDGGSAGRVPVAVSVDEPILKPEEVAALGGGDLGKGKQFLDQLVAHARLMPSPQGTPAGARAAQGPPPMQQPQPPGVPPQVGRPMMPAAQPMPPQLAQRYAAPQQQPAPAPQQRPQAPQTAFGRTQAATARPATAFGRG